MTDVAADPGILAEVEQVKTAFLDPEVGHEAIASTDITALEAEAERLRAASDSLRDQLLDARPSEADVIGPEKRRIDAEAFEIEQAIRAIQDAGSQLDSTAISAGVPFNWG